jgi:hypothetical protein
MFENVAVLVTVTAATAAAAVVVAHAGSVGVTGDNVVCSVCWRY